MTTSLDIDIATRSPQWTAVLPKAEALARDATEAVWQRAGHKAGQAEVSIVLGDDALLQSLNGRYRDRNQPTNVLSFPAEDTDAPGAPRMLGDVILAVETLVRESREQRKPLADHFLHLCVHGMLHLLGHDHQCDTEATTMEALEIETLSTLGVANPYAAAPIKTPA